MMNRVSDGIRALVACQNRSQSYIGIMVSHRLLVGNEGTNYVGPKP